MRSKHAQLNGDGSRLQRVRVCTRLKAAAEIRVTSERGRASSQPCWVRGGELMLQLFQARSGSVNSMTPVSSARPTSLRLKFKSAHSQLLSNHLKLNPPPRFCRRATGVTVYRRERYRADLCATPR